MWSWVEPTVGLKKTENKNRSSHIPQTRFRRLLRMLGGRGKLAVSCLGENCQGRGSHWLLLKCLFLKTWAPRRENCSRGLINQNDSQNDHWRHDYFLFRKPAWAWRHYQQEVSRRWPQGETWTQNKCSWSQNVPWMFQCYDQWLAFIVYISLRLDVTHSPAHLHKQWLSGNFFCGSPFFFEKHLFPAPLPQLFTSPKREI